MRVFTEPIEELLLAVAGGGVAHFAAEALVLGEAEVGGAFAGGIRCSVPAPLRLRAERHLRIVGFGKALQARRVDGEGEFSVADREWRAGVDSVQRRVMAGDHFASIDGSG